MIPLLQKDTPIHLSILLCPNHNILLSSYAGNFPGYFQQQVLHLKNTVFSYHVFILISSLLVEALIRAPKCPKLDGFTSVNCSAGPAAVQHLLPA